MELFLKEKRKFQLKLVFRDMFSIIEPNLFLCPKVHIVSYKGCSQKKLLAHIKRSSKHRSLATGVYPQSDRSLAMALDKSVS